MIGAPSSPAARTPELEDYFQSELQRQLELVQESLRKEQWVGLVILSILSILGVFTLWVNLSS